MVAEENLPFIVPPGDERALRDALAELAADPAQRKRIGEANRLRARKEYDEAAMIERYKALYWSLMDRKFA
jgi:glycosyltransferase involved in cell wall biosynthesis